MYFLKARDFFEEVKIEFMKERKRREILIIDFDYEGVLFI
jgi:hypothetical protein